MGTSTIDNRQERRHREREERKGSANERKEKEIYLCIWANERYAYPTLFSQPLTAPPHTCGFGDNDLDATLIWQSLLFHPPFTKNRLRYCILYVCCTNARIHEYLVQEDEMSNQILLRQIHMLRISLIS